ncbi:MAG: hypothetical protein LQ342_000593 [Letrouitia transgressa]|nr:MAG: hypothetical protein LQ342_000593 [Letrouitia transgressa]
MTFSKTQFWSEYDVFGRQKVEALKASRPAIIELAGRYKTIVQQLNKPARSPSTGSSNTEELLFREVCDICLWGNGSDLSILASLGPEQLQSRQGEEARKKAEKNVIVNQIRSAYSVLKEAQAKNPGERRVDIVLDNAGFELFVDLILASFLLTSNLATEVVLHTKTIPWFISDATEQDFWALLDALEFPRRFFETPTEDQKHNSIQPERLSDEEVTNMQVLSVSWNSFHENRTLAVQPTWFWTNYQDYRELPTHAKDIFEQFQQSELVIFKGDLNYRKLTGDLAWPVDTSFQMAIGDLGGPSNVRVLALRTCKADVVVGIPKSMDKHLRATTGKPDGPREWAWSGEWAVMQFFDGKEEARGAEERAQYSGNTDSDAAESVYG